MENGGVCGVRGGCGKRSVVACVTGEAACWRYLRVVVQQEEVAEGLDVDECLDDDVDVVGGFDVVQPAEPGEVLGEPGEAADGLGDRAQLRDVLLGERRRQQVLRVCGGMSSRGHVLVAPHGCGWCTHRAVVRTPLSRRK